MAMNRQGGQPLRYPGYVQQSLRENRAPNLGSGRLQNASKMGNGAGAGWGFGAPTNGISGIAGTQSRQAGTGPTSFAQSIAGSHSATPLDMSEFPSLSGTSQSHFQNTNNPIWQRPTQQTPVQRPPPHAHANTSQQVPSSGLQHPASPSNEDIFGSSNIQGSLDDYRQPNTNQMASRQPPNSGVDDFPPLGCNGTDEHNTEQSRFGFPSQPAFPQDASSRSNLPATFPNPAESSRSSTAVDRTMSPASNRTAPTPTNNISSLLSSFNNIRAPSANQQSSVPDMDNRIPEQQRIEDMSDADRYGLAGFLARMRSRDEVTQMLTRGHDLTMLGLNLNSTEPLWQSWEGPFPPNRDGSLPPGMSAPRPLIPDFNLPECYTVTNVHQVRQKLPSFSDETLFWIFYTQPRDIIQELAASELTTRNWRFHKSLQIWLTKDQSMPEPIRLTEEAEKGSYFFFDYVQWSRTSIRSFELHYSDLAPANGRVNGAS